jgi:heterodisulfide reductase subunit A-like polyferredoxin
MAVARAAKLMPLREETVPVSKAALVIGGGIAGMIASLALADQGFPVHLVEQDEQLGGTARRLHQTLDGEDLQAFLALTIDRVFHHPRIRVHLQARVAKVDGHVGEFTSTIVSNAEGPSSRVEHGVVVVATGATEHQPQTYGYGQSDKILTQLELSERLGCGRLVLPVGATVVMIQCVEQRCDERPYCSRVCCTSAVRNALLLMDRDPNARILVLYRDIRTYGFREAAYAKAREKGVLFVRYGPERPPQLSVNGDGVRLRVREPALGRDLEIHADLVVLAVPMVPRADREELSELLRVPLHADGFFIEAHRKLRPVDFASEGLFLCGTAQAPKFVTETIAQAGAVASRAAAILSKKRMPIGGQTAWVDPDKCISCMTCVHVCPYLAPRIGRHNKAEIQGAVCMGCGSCTAECPARAITLRHYDDAQILAAVEGLLQTMQQEEPAPQAYPEQAGVALPRWHRSVQTKP